MSIDQKQSLTSEELREMFVRLGIVSENYQPSSTPAKEIKPMDETKFVIALLPALGDATAKRFWDMNRLRFVDCNQHSGCHYSSYSNAHSNIPQARAKLISGNLQVESVLVTR